jgi:hypothetical protein
LSKAATNTSNGLPAISSTSSATDYIHVRVGRHQ